MLSLTQSQKQKALIWFLFFVVLGFAYMMKRPCLVEAWGGVNKVEYSKFCYNDIQALYGARGLSERKIPYFEATPYEYPPLIAAQMYLTSLVVRNHSDFFMANWLVNVLCLAGALFFLLRVVTSPRDAIYFCLSSCLLLYAGMNWDASSVLLTVLVTHSFERKNYSLCGLFGGLALGGKLFPVLCFLPLAIENLKDKAGLKKMVLGGVTGVSILYLPLFTYSLWKTGNVDSVLSIFSFHAKRLPEYDTFWHWTSGFFGYSPFDDQYRIFVERLSLVLFFISALLICFFGKGNSWKKSGALVVVLLLVSKIYSPQYALWLLPFIVLNPPPVKWIYAFYFTDLWGFIARFSWYPTMGTPDEFFWKNQLMWAVFCRCFVMLVFVCWWARSVSRTSTLIFRK